MAVEEPGSPTSVVRPLPSRSDRRATQERLDEAAPWFYPYRFDNGAATQVADPVLEAIHRTRAELVFPVVDELFDRSWDRTRCVDVGCHEGWFSTQLAVRGAAEVVGVDVRQEHLARASRVADLTRLERLRYEHASLDGLVATASEPYDLVFFLGVLYHLDDPVAALRSLRTLTRVLAVVETQVARAAAPVEAQWGAGTPRTGPALGVFPSDEAHREGDRPLAVVPTLEALYVLLEAAGFRRLHLAAPSPGMQEQYLTHDRVVVFASP